MDFTAQTVSLNVSQEQLQLFRSASQFYYIFYNRIKVKELYEKKKKNIIHACAGNSF